MLAAIIQARMGSSRFPGKTLADLNGKPMLERLIERVRSSAQVEEVIIATTTEERDDAIERFAKERGIKLVRGSETDVLSRFHLAATRYGVKTVVRVTPDCPLLDPRVMDQVIDGYRSGPYDYFSNTLGRCYPDGLDVEVFSIEALEKAHKEAKLPSEREHVTLYMKNSGKFRLGWMDAPEGLSTELKWSVDREEDLSFARAVYQRLEKNGRPFHYEEILQLIREDAQLSGINRSSVVNEGYFRSILKDPLIPPREASLARGRELLERTLAVIPGGSQTFSKGPTQFVQGVAPAFAVRGKGCRFWDADGNEYLDCGMALGAVILGYADEEVNEAVRGQLEHGTIFTLPHPLEMEVAEILCRLFPRAEMARFGKNGSDVTSGAVRLARAVTGREVIATCGYHGWQDWSIGATTRSRGVPEAVRRMTAPFQYNRIESLERIFAEHPAKVAAVIMEPVGVIPPEDGFLQRVKDLCRREGALLIFDEVLTGFRFGLGGAQGHFGVQPDLTCVGKAMANGFPLSAILGPKALLREFEEIFFSFTFGGETLSLAATKATLQKMRRQGVAEQIWRQGQWISDGYNVLARRLGLEKATQCVGLGPRTVVQFNGRDEKDSLALKSLFQQECIRRGVLFTGYHLPSFSHAEPEVDRILHVYHSALKVLVEAVEKGDAAKRLEGRPVEPVFRSA